MVNTNVDRFPNGTKKINARPINKAEKSSLAFNDRPSKEPQIRTIEIMKELKELEKNDPKA